MAGKLTVDVSYFVKPVGPRYMLWIFCHFVVNANVIEMEIGIADHFEI